MPELLEALRAIDLHPITVDDIDPDDAIATATVRWQGRGDGDTVVVVTNKRLHTLIAIGALLWDPYKKECHDRVWVEEKYCVLPAQLADYLALIGNPLDGVPGVSGVGPKKAAALLRSYGSLEGIMAGAGILMDRLGATLRRERSQLFLSRELVALKTDATLGVSWRTLAWHAS